MRDVRVFNSSVAVFQDGEGEIPLLVVGPATLFRKRAMLPQRMKDLYTIYFIDIFSKEVMLTKEEINSLTLDDFIIAIQDIQLQMGLNEISLFTHSAMGVLGYEYASKYPDKVVSLIMVATAPIWTPYKKRTSDLFFHANADKSRKNIYRHDLTERDIAETRKRQTVDKRDEFINDYVSKRSLFFYDLNNPLASKHMWHGVRHNMELVIKYFTLIQGYDIRRSQAPSTPVFLALGMYDSSIPFFSWTDDVKEMLKSMYYHIFDKSGHYPMMEQPERFMIELQNFTNSNCSYYCQSKL